MNYIQDLNVIAIAVLPIDENDDLLVDRLVNRQYEGVRAKPLTAKPLTKASFESLFDVPGLGKKGIAEIGRWLS